MKRSAIYMRAAEMVASGEFTHCCPAIHASAIGFPKRWTHRAVSRHLDSLQARAEFMQLMGKQSTSAAWWPAGSLGPRVLALLFAHHFAKDAGR